MDLDAPLCKQLLLDVLPKLSLLDPACGSGAFLIAAMRTLVNIYAAIIGKIKFLNNPELSDWLRRVEKEHRSLAYFIKKRIITDNLFGVDIMEEATEIARLRLFLALVAAAENADQLEPLPNIDFNILSGNSLIGLMRVEDKDFDQRHKQGNLFRKSYQQVLEEKNRLIDNYRHAATFVDDLTSLRDNIQEKKKEALATLDEILVEEFRHLGIKSEDATWDGAKSKPGKPRKRPVTLEDIRRLQPFHWGYEFDRIINQQAGFDAIITNPPWEIVKPNAKEFFEEFSDIVTKNKMTIHEFEKEQAKILKNAEVRQAWLCYLSSYPHVSAFYRSTPQYKNQISVVNGKKAGTDINLYKLFMEQCFNLLRPGGECGIVIPSGIYTDLGAKQLREMLFSEAGITGLFGFENRKQVFENVDSRFKFVVLTFEKGSKTDSFPAAFMRRDVEELERFPADGAIEMSVDLIRRLSPESLSLMEFKNDMDVRIAEKMLSFPLLGEHRDDAWNLRFNREFDMTNDSGLFKAEPGPGRLPLYEGKMIHQFDHRFSQPRYWVDEKEGRSAVLGRAEDRGQTLDYQCYRLGFRDVARNTDERTMIATIIPPSVFAGNTLITSTTPRTERELLLILALLNSLVVDYSIRQKVSAHCNLFYVYQLPVPRAAQGDPVFGSILDRSARLACTAPEFDKLAREAGLEGHVGSRMRPSERATFRAELDGLVAHLYGLTEEEFAYILSTFPLVADPIKVAARNAYRDVERGLIR
jgi:Alw26I/Eco31I/Esp3I family type II restriction m6 adenine DNA methyltransferase